MHGDDMHISRELLEAVATGNLPPRLLLQLLQQHLTSLCPHCHRELEAFGRAQQRSATWEPESLEVPLTEIQGKLQTARKWIEELRPLDEEARTAKIDRARKRFRGRMFARLLLQEARKCLPNDPAGSHAWARAALASVYYARDQDESFVLALAYKANAHRLLGDVPEALEEFAWARRAARQRGIIDTEIYAELDRLQASLYIDLREFEEAEHLLSRSAMLYRLLHDEESTAKVLMKLSNLYTYRGDLVLALDVDRAALNHVDSRQDPLLYLYARLNLASDLVEVGEALAARELLAEDEELLARHADACIRSRTIWLEGRVAAATGDSERAEERLLTALDALAEGGNGFDVACVSLDLAMLYHRQSRHEAVAETAARAVTLFASREVHRDALAALILLRDAAAAKQATTDTLHKVAAFLKEARTNPVIHFEPAN